MTSPTTNKGYTYPAHGGAVNSWDTPLNTNFDQIDQNLGSAYLITVTSTATTATYNSTGATLSSTVATATLPTANAQNLFYNVTGTLTQNLDLAFPAVGSFYGIYNNTSGSFSLTAVVSGSTSVNVAVAQGGTNFVITDGSNCRLANSNVLAKLQTYLGNPNGNVAGTVGSANGAATDAIWDATNRQLYIPSVSGSTATTVWMPEITRPTPQGCLTISADANNPLVSTDTTSTTVKYIPFNGNWMTFSNGTILFPFQFSTMTLTLTNAQAANVIYDVYAIWNSGSPMIGTGPAWSVSTAGSGSRGAAAALTRLGGLWVNNLAITLTNNGAPTACGVNEGIFLGSIFIDSVAGNVSCLPTYGQSRKWGVSNAYVASRLPVTLRIGDPNASWSYTTTTYRPSNNDPNNSGSVFSCLPDINPTVLFTQNLTATTAARPQNGVGWNSTTTPSGFQSDSNPTAQWLSARYSVMAPTIGANTVTCLEKGASGTNGWKGTESGMLMEINWMA